jgi:predicted nucleic acid-binding Zn ribbon protein
MCDKDKRARLGVKVLTSVRIQSCVVESLDQLPLCIAGRGVHLEITSNEKLAIHGC